MRDKSQSVVHIISTVSTSMMNNLVKNTGQTIEDSTLSNQVDSLHKSVMVKSSARLHMGFFDLNASLGRKFGSIGLSLAEPSIKLQAKISPTIKVVGSHAVAEDIQNKAHTITSHLIKQLNLNHGVTIEIQQFVLAHAGLGSGTQLALTIGAAINSLFNLQLKTRDIAILTGRGGRSGIGIAAFDFGGLLVDGGRKNKLTDLTIPPLLARYDFPASWRILLIFDHEEPGLHGNDETIAFNELPEFPEDLAAHLCRHVLMQAMPAIVEKDLQAFGESIQVLQAHTGDYFAPAQGGRYASQSVAKVLDFLQKNGVNCFGQSSWGPTGFAVFENEKLAGQILAKCKMQFNHKNISYLVTSAQNKGATITKQENF
jgi:beta-ribofuranosylaminobenzene 5'-phosphate synthase